MQTKDFFNGKYTNDFNKDQKKTIEPIVNHLSKIGIQKMSCNEELMDCKYNGLEHPSETFNLEFELVNNMIYHIHLDYTGRVHITIKDHIIDDVVPNHVFWS